MRPEKHHNPLRRTPAGRLGATDQPPISLIGAFDCIKDGNLRPPHVPRKSRHLHSQRFAVSLRSVLRRRAFREEQWNEFSRKSRGRAARKKARKLELRGGNPIKRFDENLVLWRHYWSSKRERDRHDLHLPRTVHTVPYSATFRPAPCCTPCRTDPVLNRTPCAAKITPLHKAQRLRFLCDLFSDGGFTWKSRGTHSCTNRVGGPPQNAENLELQGRKSIKLFAETIESFLV